MIGGAGIVAAFVVSKVVGDRNVGRYISNWFYLVPLVVVMAAFGVTRAGPDWLRRAAIAWGALWVVAGVAAAPAALTSLPSDIAFPDTRELIRFLDANGLDYGYAPFWATKGAAAEWLTDGRIVIRPISRSSSGHLVARGAQTFPSWFESSDVPPGQKRFFFLAAPDGEVCPNSETCEAMARREWGEPQQVLRFGEVPVMVWDRPMVTGLPDSATIAAVPVLQPDLAVQFGRDGAGGALQGRGWSGVEGTGAWTEAREAVLKIHLADDWTGPARLELVASAFPAHSRRAPQVVTVVADGRVLATWTVAPWQLQTYTVTLPADIAEQKRIALVLQVPGATRPSDLRYRRPTEASPGCISPHLCRLVA